MKTWLKVFLAIIALLFLYSSFNLVSTYAQSATDAGTIQVYGSHGCPWCVKQLDYFKQKGIPVVFTDCEQQSCPDFVSGFPTLIIDGQVKAGYTETAGPLISPVF